MERELFRKAYAKINLHLAVGLPDATGYHALESIFTKIEFWDLLKVTWEASPTFSIEVRGLEQYCKAGSDSISKAAMLWFEQSGVPLSLVVDCQKFIPVKAGLGGGSSDAATILMVLQELAGPKALDSKTLFAIGRSVGSDVSFFLSGCDSALVRGKGELIEPLDIPSKSVLLVMPTQFAISTAEAYRAIDEGRDATYVPDGQSLSRVLSALPEKCQNWKLIFYNDFLSVTRYTEFYDELNSLSVDFEGFGDLTGSGACWFFVSENKDMVLNLKEKIDRCYGSAVRMWLTALMH
ncbi:hypothetical protein [uncultured Sphaerochaeta sp.]|uniref:4-(cytidine 5'-diphospho)-2-C-methyl-D-erythritol kinase n=1 Tax=uncultured Sphaerochaeta sp. TaxID=886478 RepID=UPI002A0A3097|nr:hypothetical protein [uncultured Sphaerochaeta sp.]